MAGEKPQKRGNPGRAIQKARHFLHPSHRRRAARLVAAAFGKVVRVRAKQLQRELN